MTTFTYDDVGNVLTVTDPLSNTTTYEYDDVYRLTRETDDLSGETDYTYDLAGNLLTLTDPEENTTTWTYDAAGRVTQETNELSDSYSYDYDDAGNLIRQTNRDGRIIEYDYSDVNLLTEERWIEGTTTVHTITFAYDDVGRMTSASDSDSTVSYVYDLLGQATSITQTIADLGSSVVLGATYDSVGNRIQLAATIGTTADFVNDYTYDRLNRMTRVDQSGTGVAAKRIDFTYDAASQFDTITRYADLAATELVAVSSYTFDDAGRITDLSHVQGATTLADYDWVYDLAGRVTQFTSATDGTADYTYDDTNQLTAADYDYQTDEAHTYDANGNRTDTGYTTGDANRLLTDGTYIYTYDANGNRTARFVDTDSSGTLNSGDTSITEYTWDHRNRLTNVTDRASYGGAATQSVDYVYDAFNRLIHKEIDADGDGTGTADDTFWIHDGDQAVLQFDGSTAADLSHRYLWGTAVDQLLADETVDDGGVEDVLWPLTDNLGTVRDLATYDDSTDTTTVANHKAYDAFGNVTSETNSAVDTLFGYTGRLFDDDTGLQNNRNRWYDPAVAQWVSEDPIGFAGGDANLSRYVGNNVTGAVDPWGLEDSDGAIHTDAGTACDTINTEGDFMSPVYWQPKEFIQDPRGLGEWTRVYFGSLGLFNESRDAGAPILIGYCVGNEVNIYSEWSPSLFTSVPLSELKRAAKTCLTGDMSESGRNAVIRAAIAAAAAGKFHSDTPVIDFVAGALDFPGDIVTSTTHCVCMQSCGTGALYKYPDANGEVYAPVALPDGRETRHSAGLDCGENIYGGYYTAGKGTAIVVSIAAPFAKQGVVALRNRAATAAANPIICVDGKAALNPALYEVPTAAELAAGGVEPIVLGRRGFSFLDNGVRAVDNAPSVAPRAYVRGVPESSDVVTLWKAPDVGRTGVLEEVSSGYSPARYPGNGPYFATEKPIATGWQKSMKNGLQEVNLPRSTFDELVHKGIIQVDRNHLKGSSWHVPADRLSEFNEAMRLGPTNQYHPQVSQ